MMVMVTMTMTILPGLHLGLHLGLLVLCVGEGGGGGRFAKRSQEGGQGEIAMTFSTSGGGSCFASDDTYRACIVRTKGPLVTQPAVWVRYDSPNALPSLEGFHTVIVQIETPRSRVTTSYAATTACLALN